MLALADVWFMCIIHDMWGVCLQLLVRISRWGFLSHARWWQQVGFVCLLRFVCTVLMHVVPTPHTSHVLTCQLDVRVYVCVAPSICGFCLADSWLLLCLATPQLSAHETHAVCQV